jgi:nucleotide-binding universal stress UspA family protein
MLVDVDTAGVKMEKRMVQGRTDLEIVRIAAIEDFDFIVMATHGYVGLDHLIKGSVAEKVVRTAPCPVLVVKALDYRFRLPGKTKIIRKEDLEKS